MATDEDLEPTHQAVVQIEPDDDGDEDEPTPVAAPRPARLLLIGGVAGLALLAVGAVGIGVLASGSGPALDASDVHSPTAGATVAQDHAVFQWAPVADDARYTFTAAAPDGTVLLEERDLTEPTAEIPPAALVHVDKVLWHVRVALPSGRSFDGPTFETAVSAAPE
ncbi:MAG: hypothetical protein R3F59_01245 [Myxococcota bacterium]